MGDNYIELLTVTQAKYHLLNGEVICFDFKNGRGCFTLQDDNKVKVQLMRRFGASTDYLGDLDKFEDMAELFCEGDNLYLYEGAWIEDAKPRLIDRVVDWFRNIKET